MVLLEDTTYADLQSSASKSHALEAHTADLRAQLEAEREHREQREAEIADLKVRLNGVTPQAEPEPQETREQQHQRFEILRLHAEILRLREKLGLAVRRIFGPKSERRISGQESCLFKLGGVSRAG